MTLRLRGSDRALVGMVLKHAIQEVGHDTLALNDLKALGAEITEIPSSNALPATAALKAYCRYLTVEPNPVAYLGSVYFLEYLPTVRGSGYLAILKSLGVPEAAMSFIADHAKVDIHHNKLMDRYLENLVHGEADLAAFIYAMQVTAFLYTGMLAGAIDQVDRPKVWGLDHNEIARSKGRDAAKLSEFA